MWWVLALVGLLLLGIIVYDLTQKKHAILRNFPIIGHFRYLLETIGPELRQYIVTGNDEERPFSRDQRRWVYASSKKQNEYFGFGTDNDPEMASNYLIIKQSNEPFRAPEIHALTKRHYPVPCAKVLGGHRGRKKAFRPSSVVNISAMSFGSLSGPAVEAMNRGCKIANCLQNTGEGGVSSHHLKGGDLIYQIGTGYFGCRRENGHFSLDRFKETVEKGPVRAVEVKISQGAKPGLGGVLPGSKVTVEIAAARGVKLGQTCISPAYHTSFRDADELLDFVELLADTSGLPVGVKSAVGQLEFFEDLAKLMERGDRGVDFIHLDGGEGGTGAAPLTFSDHVALPFKLGFSRVYSIFARREMCDKVVFLGAGKLGFPETALFAFGLGVDMVMVAREAMLAVGCIQAQRCHTNHCPTGVATQNKWLTRGLDPTDKAHRVANYIGTLRKEVMRLSWATGVAHPALVSLDKFEIMDGLYGGRDPRELFKYEAGWGQIGRDLQEDLNYIMDEIASPVI